MPLPSVHEAFLASPSSRGLGLRMVTQKCEKLHVNMQNMLSLYGQMKWLHIFWNEMTLVLTNCWCKKASNQLAPALSGAGFMPKAGEFWLDRPFLLPPSVETLNKGPQKKIRRYVGRKNWVWIYALAFGNQKINFWSPNIPNWFPYLPCLVVFPTKLAVQAPTSTKWKESEALLPARRRTGPCWGEALVPGTGEKNKKKNWYFQASLILYSAHLYHLYQLHVFKHMEYFSKTWFYETWPTATSWSVPRPGESIAATNSDVKRCHLLSGYLWWLQSSKM